MAQQAIVLPNQPSSGGSNRPAASFRCSAWAWRILRFPLRLMTQGASIAGRLRSFPRQNPAPANWPPRIAVTQGLLMPWARSGLIGWARVAQQQQSRGDVQCGARPPHRSRFAERESAPAWQGSGFRQPGWRERGQRLGPFAALRSIRHRRDQPAELELAVPLAPWKHAEAALAPSWTNEQVVGHEARVGR